MTTKASPAAWIAQEMQAEPLRAKSLLMTLFGDAIAPHGIASGDRYPERGMQTVNR